MRGKKSDSAFYRTFDTLDVFVYQCSKYSTSNEIESVFKSAIERQKSYDERKQPTTSCVFLDEAGLPKKEKQPLKVLHFYLDHPKVAFVGITNEPFDNAKANRVINVFRPEPAIEELEVLAKGCIEINDKYTIAASEKVYVKGFCSAYQKLRSVNEEDNKPLFPFFFNRFSLRDFYHCLRFFRRKAIKEASESVVITAEFILQSLERNFNGVKQEYFEIIVDTFFECIEEERKKFADQVLAKQLMRPERKVRTQLECLRDSLNDKSSRERGNMNDTSVRFKLVIDSSEDDSAARILFQLGLLNPETTEVFELSEFPDDKTESAKHQIISKIKIAMEKGSTAVLINTTCVAGSFYDLFNQHYREMQGNFYTNIAIGAFSRPCVVHPDFQVVFHLRESELSSTPMPFLNRFEKYLISVHDILNDQLSKKSNLKQVVSKIKERCEAFVQHIGEDNFYGFVPQATVSSLFIDLVADLTKKEKSFSAADFLKYKKATVREYAKKLMQVCPPEAVFNSILPPEYLHSYLEEFEHFELNQFLKNIMKACDEKTGENTENKSFTKNIIFTRTSSQILAMESYKDFIFEENVMKEVHLLEMTNFSSEKEFQIEINKFFGRNPQREDRVNKRVCIINIEIHKIRRRIVNRVRQMIDCAIQTSLESMNSPSKHIVLVVHFPPESLRVKRDYYPTLFLNGWDFHFFDSIGTYQKDILGIKNLLRIASKETTEKMELKVEEEKINSKEIDRCFEYALTSAVCFLVPSSMDEIKWKGSMKGFYDPNSKPGKRKQTLDALFMKLKEIKEKILAKFSNIFSVSMLNEILRQTAKQILSGNSIECLSLAVLENLNSLFATYLSVLLEEISSDYNLQTIHNSIKRESKQFVLHNFDIMCPEISFELIKERRTGVKQISLSSLKNPPNCPFSPTLIRRMTILLDQVIQETPEEERANYVLLSKQLKKKVSEDRLGPVFEYLCDPDNLFSFNGYLQDVIENKLAIDFSSSTLEMSRMERTMMHHWLMSQTEQKNDVYLLHIAVTLEFRSWYSYSLTLKPLVKHNLINLNLKEFAGIEDSDKFRVRFDTALVESFWKALYECKIHPEQEKLQSWLTAFRNVLNVSTEFSNSKGKHGQKLSLMVSLSSFLSATKCDIKLGCELIEQIFNFELFNEKKPRIEEQIIWLFSLDIFKEENNNTIRLYTEDLLMRFAEICSPYNSKKFKEDVVYVLGVINETPKETVPAKYLSYSFRKYLFHLVREYIVQQKNKQESKQDSKKKSGMSEAQFLDLAKEIALETLGNNGVDENYTPSTLIEETRKSCAIADIFYDIFYQEIMQLRSNMDEFWSSLFSLLVEDFKLNSPGEEFKAIKLSAAQNVMIEMIADALCERDDEIFTKGLPFLLKENYMVYTTEINRLMKDKGRQMVLFSHIKRKKSINYIEQILKNENVLRYFGEWMAEWKDNYGGGNASKELKYHKFSFMMGDEIDPEAVQYSKVKEAFLELVGESKSVRKKDKLVNVCKQYSGNDKDKIYLHRMFIVLLVYYEVFNQNVNGKELVNSLSELFTFLDMDEKEKNLVCAFLDPPIFFCKPNAEDSIGIFFSSRIDADLLPARHALINMLAAVYRLPKESNHLYTHIFKPSTMKRTCGVGSQYDHVIDYIHYDCGCELTETGSFVPGRPQRPPFQLDALYLVYFVSFGAFCLATLADQSACRQLNGEKEIYGRNFPFSEILFSFSGPVLSGHAIESEIAGNIRIEGDFDQMTRDFCFQRVGSCWFWMENLGLTFEKKCVFVTLAMEKFIKVVKENPQKCRNLFHSISDVKEYETLWNDRIFTPALQEVDRVAEVMEKEVPLESLKLYCKNVKESISIEAVRKNLLSAPNKDLSILSEFYLTQQPSLKHSLLIPDIIEIYEWIHKKLAYLFSEQEAAEISVLEVIKKYTEKTDKVVGQKMERTYKRMLKAWNGYLNFTGGVIGLGACGHEQIFPKLEEGDGQENKGTSLISLLTCSDTDFNNLLIKMLKDLLKIQNNFLKFIENNANQVPQFELYCCKVFDEIPASQIPPLFYKPGESIPTSSSILITGDLEGKFEGFLLSQATQNEEGKLEIDFQRVQQFVLCNYLNNRCKLIEQTNLSVFKFKRAFQQEEKEKEESSVFQDLLTNSRNLFSQLPEQFKSKIEGDSLVHIDNSLESVPRETLREILQALCSLSNLCNTRQKELDTKETIEAFLKGMEMSQTVRQLPQPLQNAFVSQIGSLVLLLTTKIEDLSSNVDKSLRIPIAEPLSQEIREKVLSAYSKKRDELIQEIKEVLTISSECYEGILRAGYEEKSLGYYLQEVEFCDVALLSCIPESIVGKHVYSLEKLLTSVMREILAENEKHKSKEEKKVFVEIEEGDLEDGSAFKAFKKLELAENSWKSLLLSCSLSEREAEQAEAILNEAEIDVKDWKDFVADEERPEGLSLTILSKLALLGKWVSSEKAGQRIRVHLQLVELPYEKQSAVPEGYQSWKDLLAQRCSIEDSKRLEKYVSMLEEQDVYLCHWIYLTRQDLKGMEDKEVDSFLFFKEAKITEGHKFRERLIELKKIEDHEKIQVEGQFEDWEDFFLKIDFKKEDANKYSQKMEEIEMFLCHWKFLDTDNYSLLKAISMPMGLSLKVKKLFKK